MAGVADAGGDERAREKEKWFRKAHDMVIAMFKARLGRRRRAGDKGWVLEGLPHCESLARGLWELGEDCRPHLVIALEPDAYVSIRQHTPADARAGAAEKRGDTGKEEVERTKQQVLGAGGAAGGAAGAHETLTHAGEQAQADSTAARALATDKRSAPPDKPPPPPLPEPPEPPEPPEAAAARASRRPQDELDEGATATEGGGTRHRFVSAEQQAAGGCGRSRAAGQHAHATRALREGGGGEADGVGGVGGAGRGHAAGDTSAAAAKASQAREERQRDVGAGQAAEGAAAGEREREVGGGRKRDLRAAERRQSG